MAICEEASKLGDEGRELARDTFETYLVSGRSQSKGQPKVRPTLTDSKQFETLLIQAAQACGVSQVDANPTFAPGDAEGTMSEGYKTIARCIRLRLRSAEQDAESADGDGDPRLEALERLRDAILERLEFVEIRLGTEHDPNEVFDRLNQEGERLGILDLVRNEVLKHLDSDPQAAQAAFSNDWTPFESGFADDNAKAKYFFPFALTINDLATQATTFRTLTDHLASLDSDAGKSHGKVELMVRSLRRHQTAYNAIASGRLAQLSDPVREQVRRLVDLRRPSSTFPYILQLLTTTAEGSSSAKDAADCLAVIESFLVRRALCGIEPTGLHAVFKKLWGVAGSDPQKVRAGLVTKTVVYPNDQAFEVAIRTGDLYSRNICRYVIEEYERAHSTADIMRATPPITIDHVVPQSRKGDWEATWPRDEHAALLHTWGNLVPLSNEANSTKGSANWKEARAKLKLETVFSTTKHIYDQYEEWTPDSVRHRADGLAEWAMERWPSYT